MCIVLLNYVRHQYARTEVNKCLSSAQLGLVLGGLLGLDWAWPGCGWPSPQLSSAQPGLIRLGSPWVASAHLVPAERSSSFPGPYFGIEHFSYPLQAASTY